MNVLLSWCEKKECDVVSKSLLSIMRMPWRMKMSHIAPQHHRGIAVAQKWNVSKDSK
jgi:hypothetical protein